MSVRPNDEQRSGLLVIAEILQGMRVAVPEGLFPPANLRLLEALGVSVKVKRKGDAA